jgi:hypothetical protein
MEHARQVTTKGWLIVGSISGLILVATAIPYVLWLEPTFPTMAAGVVFAIVGGILVARRPDNVLGRLLVSMAVVWALGEGAYTYLASESRGRVARQRLRLVAQRMGVLPDAASGRRGGRDVPVGASGLSLDAVDSEGGSNGGDCGRGGTDGGSHSPRSVTVW